MGRIIKIQDKFEIPDEDVYMLYLREVQLREGKGDKDDWFGFTFEIFGSDEGKWDSSYVWGATSLLISPKSRLRNYINVLNPDIIEGLDGVDADDLCAALTGCICRGLVEHKDRTDGEVSANVKTLIRAKAGDYEAFKVSHLKKKGAAKSKTTPKPKPKPTPKSKPKPEPTKPSTDGGVFPPPENLESESIKPLRVILAQLGVEGGDLAKKELQAICATYARIYDQEIYEGHDISALKLSYKLLEMPIPKPGTTAEDVAKMIGDKLQEIIEEIQAAAEKEAAEEVADDLAPTPAADQGVAEELVQW